MPPPPEPSREPAPEPRGRDRPLGLAFGVVATLAFALVLAWPALANGYPLVYYDSGAYVDGSYTTRFIVARAIGYALFLRFTRLADSLWVPVAFQALLTAALAVRTAAVAYPGARYRRAAVASALAAVALLSGAAKYASWIMPDVFASWLFLGGVLWYLAKRTTDRIAGGIAIGCGLLVHVSHPPIAFATALGVLAAAACVAIRRRSRAEVLRALGLVVLVLAVVPANALLHEAYDHDAPPFGGHPAFLVNRFLGAGVLVPTLDRYCGEKGWRLCRYRDELVAHARGHGSGDWFLWDKESPHRKLDPWTPRSRAELADIARLALRDFWPEIARSTLEEAVRQFRTVGDGDGLDAFSEPHVARGIANHIPHETAAFLASDQISGRPVRVRILRLRPSRTHAALLLLLGVAGLVGYARGRRRFAALGAALVLFLAVNALVICFGSTPHGRYQGRVAWLVPYALALAAWSLVDRETRGDGPAPRAVETDDGILPVKEVLP